MIYVVATITLNEGTRSPFLDEFHKIVELVRAEPGCLEYVPTLDVETSIGAQQPSNSDCVTVVEKWESIEALEDHLVASHMIEYRKRVKEMVAGTRLQILEPAGDE